jgi:glycosyltransferase involved in cell wall biosynthesis
MTKVIHLQYSTKSAGSAALRLHKAFLEMGINSTILSLFSDINDTNEICQAGRNSKIIAWVDNELQSFFITRKIYKQFGLYSFPILGTNVSGRDQVNNADIIYIHWVQFGFLNLTNILHLANLNKPIIIFMHDMWPITGGCHHSFTCEKFKTKCKNCQMFPNNKMIDWPAFEFNKKLKLYSDYNNLFFVSPSKWLYDNAKHSMLLKNKPVYYMPNVINNELFKPVDKAVVRSILNLNTDEIVVAFGAVSISSPYKGWEYMQKALEILFNESKYKNIIILIFGSGYNKEITNKVPFKVRFLGFLNDEYSMVIAYNAADVFVIPSIADNQPTSVMESLCCGTPVVGFDTGGIPDMIKHKENGYLAKYKDSGDIANGIKFCLENKIQGKILPNFEKNQVIGKHLELIDYIKIKR